MFTVVRLFACAVLIAAMPMHALAGKEVARALTMAISLMLRDPAISGHGIALENYEDERYDHSITVQWTGREGDTVEEQVRGTAEVALRVGRLVIDKGLSPPGKHLIIKMALMKRDSWFINTFSVRYKWADVLAMAKGQFGHAELGTKGKIESIWYEYWSTMCRNAPPAELFPNGEFGDALMPEDVENPTAKDLNCHRVR